MVLHGRLRRPALAALLGAALLGCGVSPAAAQAPDCARLRAAIQARDDGGSGLTRWERAAEQQRREIDRTRRSVDQAGCGEGAGAFGDEPPLCVALADRLQQMQDNLAQLQARAPRASVDDAAQRADLLARYNAQCVGGAANPAGLAPSDDGMLPGDARNPADPGGAPDDLSSVPLNGDIMDGTSEPSPARGQAICVRTCDGGYFPLSPRASEDQLDGLDQLCRASCPNTEARLYTMGKGGTLSDATAVDGTSYSALPAAFKYEKTFTATCTCKPPGKSWVESLAEAEKLLVKTDRHDITVTASLSDQMARAAAMPAAAASRGGKGQRSAPTARAVPDTSALREAQKGAQAPTASTDTSGIGGTMQFRRTLREGDGQTIGVAGPDGVKKRIRLIVP